MRIDNLRKAYRRDRPVLDGFTLHLGPGVHGLLGPNGAGKTSLIRILAGAVQHDAGTVVLNETLRLDRHPDQWRRAVGYLPQSFDFPAHTTGRELLEEAALLFSLSPRTLRPRINALLQRVNLHWAADRDASQYSRGMKQRLGFALTLLHDPPLILLDEPTAGLDPIERVLFRDLLAEIGRQHIVILSTHIVGDVERCCDRIAVIARGSLIFDGTPTLLADRVQGRVHEFPATDAEAQALVARRRAISVRREEDGGLRLRSLCDAAGPPAGAEPVAARLEDGYFDLLGGEI